MMRFPWYVPDEDTFQMTALVPTVLAQWHCTVAHHKKGLPTVNARLAHRRNLEQSFNLLKMAWAKASDPMGAAMAA